MIAVASKFGPQIKDVVGKKQMAGHRYNDRMLFYPIEKRRLESSTKDNGIVNGVAKGSVKNLAAAYESGSVHGGSRIGLLAESKPDEAPEYVNWPNMQPRLKALFDKWAEKDGGFCNGQGSDEFGPVLKKLGNYLSEMVALDPKVRFDAATKLRKDLDDKSFIPDDWTSESARAAMAKLAEEAGKAQVSAGPDATGAAGGCAV